MSAKRSTGKSDVNVKVCPGDGLELRGLRTNSDGKEVYSFGGWASTEAVDRYGDIVRAASFKKTVKPFLKNPMLLYMHSAFKPIGRVTDLEIRKDVGLYVENADILVTPWAREELLPYVDAKMVKALSIGFYIVESEPIEEEEDAESYWPPLEILETDLLEISVVSLPANPEALIEFNKSLENMRRAPVPPTMFDFGDVAQLGAPTAAPIVLKPRQLEHSIELVKADGATAVERVSGAGEIAGRAVDHIYCDFGDDVMRLQGVRLPYGVGWDSTTGVTDAKAWAEQMSAEFTAGGKLDVPLPEKITAVDVEDGTVWVDQEPGGEVVNLYSDDDASELPVGASGDGVLTLSKSMVKLSMAKLFDGRGLPRRLTAGEREAAYGILRELYAGAGLELPTLKDSTDVPDSPVGVLYSDVAFQNGEGVQLAERILSNELETVVNGARFLAKSGGELSAGLGDAVETTVGALQELLHEMAAGATDSGIDVDAMTKLLSDAGHDVSELTEGQLNGICDNLQDLIDGGADDGN